MFSARLNTQQLCELLRRFPYIISDLLAFAFIPKYYATFVSRMLWFAFICVALFSIISLSKRTWHRFQTSPMVISMDRNKLVWNTSFPSLTVCPHKRIDELKVEEYIL